MTIDIEKTSQKTTLKSPLKSWGGFVIGMLILGMVARLISSDDYYNSLVNAGFLFGGLAAAWNILGGYCGQFSFGHAVFVGIGAYSVALTKTDQNWGTMPGIILGIMISIAVAMAISWPLFRLRGSFFAIGTLAFSEVALSLALYFTWTKGALGIQIPFDRLPIVDQKVWLLVFFAYSVFCMGTSLFLIRGRLGYYMISVRDDEATAAARAKSNSGASISAHSPPGLAIQRGPKSQNPKTARHNRYTAACASIVNICMHNLVQTCWQPLRVRWSRGATGCGSCNERVRKYFAMVQSYNV